MKIRTAVALPMVAVWFAACGATHIAKVDVPTENVIRSYQLTAAGDKLLEEGKDYPALLKYLEASNLNPYHEVIFNKLAIAYSRVQMFPQAKRAVGRAIGLNPQYAFAYNTLGIVLLADQDYKKSIRSFQEAINLRPRLANFYVNLGHAYMQSNDFAKGREAYRKAIEIDPQVLEKEGVIYLSYTVPDNLDSEKHYQMARFFGELGDKKACLHYLDKALSAGFGDGKRIFSEMAFAGLLQDDDFIALLGRYGLSSQKP